MIGVVIFKLERVVEETLKLKHWDSWENFKVKFKSFRQKNKNKRLTDRYQD
jgi:hypothetical protein